MGSCRGWLNIGDRVLRRFTYLSRHDGEALAKKISFHAESVLSLAGFDSGDRWNRYIARADLPHHCVFHGSRRLDLNCALFSLLR